MASTVNWGQNLSPTPRIPNMEDRPFFLKHGLAHRSTFAKLALAVNVKQQDLNKSDQIKPENIKNRALK